MTWFKLKRPDRDTFTDDVKREVSPMTVPIGDYREAVAMIERMRQRPVLISIERKERLNVFTFKRGSDTFTIETYGAMSDDLDAWRKLAGLI